MSESKFRELCKQFGGPDNVPCDEMPEAIAVELSMEDRFFAEDDTEDAVRLIRAAGLFKDGSDEK